MVLGHAAGNVGPTSDPAPTIQNVPSTHYFAHGAVARYIDPPLRAGSDGLTDTLPRTARGVILPG
jgi:hypothetical protein